MKNLWERYIRWYDAVIKEASLHKGEEGKALAVCFEGMSVPTGGISALCHVRCVVEVLEDFNSERAKLKWAEKILEDAKEWRETLGSFIAICPPVKEIPDALAHGHLNVEEAIFLSEIASRRNNE